MASHYIIADIHYTFKTNEEKNLEVLLHIFGLLAEVLMQWVKKDYELYIPDLGLYPCTVQTD